MLDNVTLKTENTHQSSILMNKSLNGSDFFFSFPNFRGRFDELCRGLAVLR